MGRGGRKEELSSKKVLFSVPLGKEDKPVPLEVSKEDFQNMFVDLLKNEKNKAKVYKIIKNSFPSQNYEFCKLHYDLYPDDSGDQYTLFDAMLKMNMTPAEIIALESETYNRLIKDPEFKKII